MVVRLILYTLYLIHWYTQANPQLTLVLPPKKLTWNLKMMVFNRNPLFQGSFSGSMLVFGGVTLFFSFFAGCAGSCFRSKKRHKGGQLVPGLVVHFTQTPNLQGGAIASGEDDVVSCPVSCRGPRFRWFWICFQGVLVINVDGFIHKEPPFGWCIQTLEINGISITNLNWKLMIMVLITYSVS